ncbi:MAG: AI-2E family transporter [Scytolyngbya sp. HA4215-MV1]|nr:AI-2E family transporter [Scytolyngbya sp. HA4215-MV1]
MNLGQWIGLIALITAVYILWQIRQVLLLIFAAVVLATTLNMLVRRLRKTGMQRSSAVLIAFSLLVLFIISFTLLIVPPFVDQLRELIELVPRGFARLSYEIGHLKAVVPSQIRPYVPAFDQLIPQLQPYINRVLGGSFAFFSSSLGVLVNCLLVIVLMMMMLINPLAYRNLFVQLFPSFYRRRADDILSMCEVALGRWITGALIGMSVIALVSWAGLSLIGVKASLAQGVLAGLLNFIPNIGPTLSVIPPMVIGLLDAPWKSVAVLVLYIGIQQFESNLLTPYLMAQQVALLPAATLMAQVFFATVFGFLGLVLALPLTVVSQVWIREVLLRDVLDQWGKSENTAGKLALKSDLPLLADSHAPVASSDLTAALPIDPSAPTDELRDPWDS